MMALPFTLLVLAHYKEFMDMELGPETKRMIILKLRTRLKGALAEHEVKTDESTHMILLKLLHEIVDKDIQKHTERR